VQWQLGVAFGIAVMSTVLSIVGLTRPDAIGSPVPNLISYHIAFVAASVLVLVAVSFALRVRDKDAIATMQRESTRQEEVSDAPLPML
jgi:hypothetical protein